MNSTKDKKASAYTIIENHECQERQSRNLVRILRTPSGKRLAIRIKRDSYDFQSYAKVELWNDAEGKWNFVHAIPYPEMACVRSALSGKMEQDAEALLKIALLIIE